MKRKKAKNFMDNKGQNRNVKEERIVPWFPITKKQNQEFIRLSINAGWIGIGGLVLLWLVVRIIGPAAGWWTPADYR